MAAGTVTLRTRTQSGAITKGSRLTHEELDDNFLFLQSGSGAVSRTVQSKLRDVVSVKDFGAVGDGVTDDTAAIQAAIQTAGASQTILIEDTFLIGDLSVSTDLRGLGSGYLTGVATVGTKPTVSDINGAANAAAALALLEAYYATVVTVSANITLRGNFDFRKILFKSASGHTINVEGTVKYSNIAFHNVCLESTGLVVGDDLLSSYSPSVAFWAYRGGRIIATSSVGFAKCTTRGIIAQDGGQVHSAAGTGRGAGTHGLYAIFGGKIVIPGMDVQSSGAAGVNAFYGSSIDISSGTSSSNTGSGVVSESGSTIYADSATISSNTDRGVFAQGGFVKAGAATIQSNTSYGVDCQSGEVHILTATIGGAGALANNSDAVQLRSINGLIISEAAGGTGKTNLTAASYDPPHNTANVNGGYVGLFSSVDGTLEAGGVDINTNSGVLRFGASNDLILARDAANILALRNSTNPQIFYVYNTTDGTNLERVALYWSSNIARLDTLAAGTGTVRDLMLSRGGSQMVRFTATQAQFVVGITNTSDAHILSGTAIPAGGTAGSGYTFSSTSNFGVFFGSGAPSLAAAKGSLYLRSDGSTTNDRAYINTDGSTTWTALTTAA